MSALVDRWVANGIITAEQADKIRADLAASGAGAPAGPTRPVSLVAEGLGYLGGVIVVVECEHLCMSMRGIQKPGARTVTSAVRGIFASDAKTRAEAMSLVIGS